MPVPSRVISCSSFLDFQTRVHCPVTRVFSAPSPPSTALRRHSGHSCSCPLNQFMSTLFASSLSLPRPPHFSSVRSVSVHLGHCGRFFPVPSPTSPLSPHSVQMWTNVTAAVAALARRLPVAAEASKFHNSCQRQITYRGISPALPPPSSPLLTPQTDGQRW